MTKFEEKTQALLKLLEEEKEKIELEARIQQIKEFGKTAIPLSN